MQVLPILRIVTLKIESRILCLYIRIIGINLNLKTPNLEQWKQIDLSRQKLSEQTNKFLVHNSTFVAKYSTTRPQTWSGFIAFRVDIYRILHIQCWSLPKCHVPFTWRARGIVNPRGAVVSWLSQSLLFKSVSSKLVSLLYRIMKLSC